MGPRNLRVSKNPKGFNAGGPRPHLGKLGSLSSSGKVGLMPWVAAARGGACRLPYRSPGCSSWLRHPELSQLSQSKAHEASAGFLHSHGPRLLAVWLKGPGDIKMSGVISLLGLSILIYTMRHSVFVFAQRPFLLCGC